MSIMHSLRHLWEYNKPKKIENVDCGDFWYVDLFTKVYILNDGKIFLINKVTFPVDVCGKILPNWLKVIGNKVFDVTGIIDPYWLIDLAYL